MTRNEKGHTIIQRNNEKEIRKPKNRRKNEIKIGTWNIRTMLIPGKMQEVGNELMRYNIDVAALQEIRWKDQGAIDKNMYSFRYSGDKKQGNRGVGFMVFQSMKQKIIEFKPIDERMAYLRLKAKPCNISLLNIYAPTEKDSNEEKDKFYEKVEEEIEVIPKEDTIIILGDFNAQIGKEDYIKCVAGKETIHEKTNNNGQRLCNLAASTDMYISSTKFPHPKKHKITWMSPDNKATTQIDHILINRRKQTSIKDVRTYRGACADSDHFLVIAKIKQKIKKNNKGQKCTRWNITKLSEEKVRKEYETQIEELLSKIVKKEDNVNAQWEAIKKSIQITTEKHIGKVDRDKRKEWYNDSCRVAVEKKRKKDKNG